MQACWSSESRLHNFWQHKVIYFSNYSINHLHNIVYSWKKQNSMWLYISFLKYVKVDTKVQVLLTTTPYSLYSDSTQLQVCSCGHGYYFTISSSTSKIHIVQCMRHMAKCYKAHTPNNTHTRLYPGTLAMTLLCTNCSFSSFYHKHLNPSVHFKATTCVQSWLLFESIRRHEMRDNSGCSVKKPSVF